MVIVIGTNYGASLTSPPFSQADQKKKEVPGGYTLQGVDPMNLGRVSSLDDSSKTFPAWSRSRKMRWRSARFSYAARKYTPRTSRTVCSI